MIALAVTRRGSSPLYDDAFGRANDDERAMALVYLESWLKGRRRLGKTADDQPAAGVL